MKHRKKIIGVIASVMLLALAAIPVVAQIPPCAFEGSVLLDTSECSGAVITVTLEDGTPLSTMPEEVIVDENSEYFLAIPPDPATDGTVLNFYVNGYLGGTSTWEAMPEGGVKEVNLAATSGAVTYYTLTMAVSPDEVGTTTPAIGQHLCAAGIDVQLTAHLAVVGSQFDHWIINGTTVTANPTTVTMDVDTTATAYFVPFVAPGENFAGWLYETFIASL